MFGSRPATQITVVRARHRVKDIRVRSSAYGSICSESERGTLATSCGLDHGTGCLREVGEPASRSIGTGAYSRAVPLDAGGARRVYDRIGRLQDTQRFYEDRPVHRLVDLGDFGHGDSVFELGCGTGRLAATLLRSVLPSSARYVAVDVSPVMVRVASQRLLPWADRATVKLLEAPALRLPGDDASCDRFLATYVFDLLSPEDAMALLAESARLLAPGGQIALVSLTNGTTRASRVICSVWNAVALRWPSLVGGCRSIESMDLLTGPEWSVRHTEVVVRFGVPSEVVVAERTNSASA